MEIGNRKVGRSLIIYMRIYNQSIKTFILLILIFFSFFNICLAEQPAPSRPSLQDAFDISSKDKPLNSAASQGAGFDTGVEANTIIGAIIKIVLGLMGAIFLVLAIYGGYTWMMARGNEEMVEKAKNTLTNAIIGIVIVMAAYAISYFILSQISTKALKNDTSGIGSYPPNSQN